MSCKECKYSPKTYEEYCMRQDGSNIYCPDAYTEISYLCGNYDVNESHKIESEDAERRVGFPYPLLPPSLDFK